ncbi:LOW QUALITY PROTEIN: hypothetical protein CsSME_00053232 [Camellia sinensis var. sinensis]
MAFLTGSSGNSWQPVMTADTTTPSYWLNWRVMLCIIWVLLSLIITSLLISKYEGPRKSRHRNRESQEEPAGLLYEDEVWKPCLKGIHPAWLLAFRVAAFFVLLSLLIANAAVDGGEIFYFYTQTEDFDVEQGTNSNESNGEKHSESNQEHRVRQTAGFWGYIFQIVFQMNAGAVMLTDCVFWFIIVPFLAIKDYDLNFLIINMHTINAVFLLGDTALNCLRFPWFRIAYFFLWTAVYVMFQWIVHACVSLWWPYPFLDLSSTFAPLWISWSTLGISFDRKELERKKELEDLMKDMANYNVQLEGKGSACRQALLKLNHYQKTANELSILVKSSEIEKDISMNAEKLLIMETNLTAAINTKLEALTQVELMETELQMEKGMTDELLRHVSELNEAVMHSKMASNEGQKEIRVVLVEKVTELALATTTVVEAEEKLEYMRKLVEVMQDLENQLMNKFVFIDSLQSDLNQANELRGSFEKRASNAISELNTEEVERLDSDTKKMEGELEKLRQLKQGSRAEADESKKENWRLKEEFDNSVVNEYGRDESNACIKISKDEYEALIEKAEKVTELVPENYYELENLKKELEIAMVKIAEFRNRAKQVVSRVEAAEKDQMRNWREQREVALAALWEKLFPKESRSSFSYE